MKICFIPIDNRPVCYNLAKDIAAIDDTIELLIPPKSMLGSLTNTADIEGILEWLSNIKSLDSAIISLDTIAYGGLIPSRRTESSYSEIKTRIERLKQILELQNAEIHAFSSIMRISNNNYNEEEKIYWKDYGKEIFNYSYNLHKFGHADSSKIPADILDDYIKTRNRNFNINKVYLEWQNKGFLDKLIFSKDDCAEYGLNVKEAQELESLGGFTKTGADEIPLTLLAGIFKKNINVFVQYTEPDCIDLISNYEDVSIHKSVCGQLELGGFNIANSYDEADIILIVNNFRDRQGELVMGWETKPFDKDIIIPNKPYAIADVRFANGADNAFVKKLLPSLDDNFLGYSGWNTSANSIGSLLACVKVKYKADKYNEKAFKKLQIIRFLDDWGYQSNVRMKISSPCNINEPMKPYEDYLSKIFDYKIKTEYTYPWDRKFEIEINC